jgi:hypothetical protein
VIRRALIERQVGPPLSAGGRRKQTAPFAVAWLATLAGWLLVSGCDRPTPAGAIVLSQTPPTTAAANAGDVLDLRYPPGSRVVLAAPPFRTNDVLVLSAGLWAAGEPIVAPDGRRIFFVGKAAAGGDWQIYQADNGGRPLPVTAMPGGAMDPAIIATGDLVFSSPVPKVGETWTMRRPSQLFAKPISGLPRRLTFAARAAVEPTVLADGRILFVSARPTADASASPTGLFTVNNDGTEFTAFALDHDGAPFVHRPRELPGGRVVFVAADAAGRAGKAWAEDVRPARPFASRARLFSFTAGNCESIEPGADSTLLACLETRGTFGVFRLRPDAAAPGEPLLLDSAWNSLDATLVAARPEPMGHVSAMKPAQNFGTILCIDVNFTRWGPADARSAKAERIRVLAGNDTGQPRVLGEVPVLADGSFMAEVPPEVPLGFEALDAQGRVVRREPPTLWLRPGENRSCIGCHEPYNRSPDNVRPLAASAPAVRLVGPAGAGEQAGL